MSGDMSLDALDENDQVEKIAVIKAQLEKMKKENQTTQPRQIEERSHIGNKTTAINSTKSEGEISSNEDSPKYDKANINELIRQGREAANAAAEQSTLRLENSSKPKQEFGPNYKDRSSPVRHITGSRNTRPSNTGLVDRELQRMPNHPQRNAKEQLQPPLRPWQNPREDSYNIGQKSLDQLVGDSWYPNLAIENYHTRRGDPSDVKEWLKITGFFDDQFREDVLRQVRNLGKANQEKFALQAELDAVDREKVSIQQNMEQLDMKIWSRICMTSRAEQAENGISYSSNSKFNPSTPHQQHGTRKFIEDSPSFRYPPQSFRERNNSPQRRHERQGERQIFRRRSPVSFGSRRQRSLSPDLIRRGVSPGRLSGLPTPIRFGRFRGM